MFVVDQGEDKEWNSLSISFQNGSLPEGAHFDSGHFIEMTASICDWVALFLLQSYEQN